SFCRSKRKRVRYQSGLLALVTSECADCGAGAGFPSSVGDFAAEQRAQSRFDESPCAHVFWFFLTPNEFRVFGKWLEHFAHLLFCERIKLLDANERCVIDLALSAILQQIVIHFARAKDDPFHFVRGTGLRRAEEFFEPAMDEFFRGRRSKLGAQQTFWCRDNERLDELAFHLPPERR